MIADRLKGLSGPAQFESLASLKVTTHNLGDHIQIIAALGLLEELGLKPDVFLNRDHDLASDGKLPGSGPVGILLNGWFKFHSIGWPPHQRLKPLFYGFHLDAKECPELLSAQAVEYYHAYGPIGCRDPYTQKLLASKGVPCYFSNCPTLTLPASTAANREGIILSSRDRRLLDLIPSDLGPIEFIDHYSSSRSFDTNLKQARKMLQKYQSAKLIITTFLHCALPAIAMGIPVIVFYPVESFRSRKADRRRFSCLDDIIKVHAFKEAKKVNWDPEPVNVDPLKHKIREDFFQRARQWAGM